jgi:hypothetical protein
MCSQAPGGVGGHTSRVPGRLQHQHRRRSSSVVSPTEVLGHVGRWTDVGQQDVVVDAVVLRAVGPGTLASLGQLRLARRIGLLVAVCQISTSLICAMLREVDALGRITLSGFTSQSLILFEWPARSITTRE